MATKPRPSRYGKPGNRLTDATKAKILDLCRAGTTRNDIARQVGCSAASVSGVVKRAGLTFDRTRVAAATEARKVDLAARRAEIAAQLLEDAARLRAQAWEPCKAFAFGGRDNTYNETELPEPVFADKLKIMQATGVAITKHIDLVSIDADNGAAAARSMLGDLAAALGVNAAANDAA